MMSETEKNKEVKTVIYVLLPFCVELETDVFLSLLRNVVARSKLDDQQLDVFKAGMISDTLFIKSDDLSVNWKELNSESQRIRQLKLLGLWTIYNYPSLGKKLFGDSWQAPERKIVEVLGISVKSAEAVSEVILKKMKLRIVELNISHSTLLKLKHFVRVPVDVGKFNGIQISPRIKLFEIDESVIENCWKALKFGSFVSEKQPTAALQKAGQKVEHGVSVKGGPRLLPVVKRLRMDITTKGENGEKETNGGNESIRKEILEMRKEIGNLSKSCHLAGHVTEPHLKSDTEKLLKENEILNGHIERNTSLANALQKGLDSSYQINQMLESQIQVLTEKLSMAEKICLETSQKNAELQQQLLQLKDIAAKQCETEKCNRELSAESMKLHSQIQDLTEKLSGVERDLLESRKSAAIFPASQSEIQDLTKRLCETEKCNNELFDKNVKLERDLIDSIDNALTIEDNLHIQIHDLTEKLSGVERDLLELQQQLLQSKDIAAKQSETEKCNRELSAESMKLHSRIQDLTEKLSGVERDLLESRKSAAIFAASQSEIQDLTKRLCETEKCNNELSDKNVKLERDLDDSINHAVSIESNLQSRINDLTEKSAEKIKKIELESIETGKLKQEMCSLKDQAETIKAEFQNRIVIFETSLTEAKKTELKLISNNKKLEEELKKWRDKGSESESVEALDKPEHELLLKGDDDVCATKMQEKQAESQDSIVDKPIRRRQVQNTENPTGRTVVTRKKARLQ